MIASDEQQTITRAKELADRLDKVDLDGLDFIETILVYMLSLYEVELKQTRFYQEISAEERKEGELIGEQKGLQKGLQEECVKLLSRLLRRKIGVQPDLETLLQDFPNYPLEKLEDLADALLDFNAMADLETWLTDHA